MTTPQADSRTGGRPGLGAFLFDHPGAPDDVIAYWYDGRMARSQMEHAAIRVAETLRECGIAEGQPVAHIVESGATALSVMFGVWLAGAAYVPINGRLPDPEINALIEASRPAAVIARRARSIDATVTWMLETPGWEWVTRAAQRPWDGEPLPAGTALVMRTSGTTGNAKPVRLSHDGVAEGIDTVMSSLRDTRPRNRETVRAPMPNLIPASLALWAGIWNVLFALRAGSPVVLMDRFDTLQFADLVRRHEIRSTVLAPAMMSMLTEDRRVTDLAPLTMVRSVTAPLTPNQARAFNGKFGIGIMNCYGQTELGGEVVGWTAKDLREHGEDKLGSVGRPHAGIEIRVVDDAGVELPPGQVGEIWISSPFATRDVTISERVEGGFLRTGDIGLLDSDGFLWLQGRASDMINRGGLKVLPHEIEEQLCQRPDVAEACVAGVPDRRLGEVPVAWVRPMPATSVDPVAVLADLRTTLAGYKVPIHLELVSEMPRNEIGKILRRSLIEQWTAQHGGADELTM